MTLLDKVQAARERLEQDRLNRPMPAPGDKDGWQAWWEVRKALISDVWEAETAATKAGLLTDYTGDF